MSRNSQSRVVDYIVDAVATLGVRHIFGVDGANIEDLYDAIFCMNTAAADIAMTGIVAKHEFSAATMADGYSRTTSGLGVVAATSGGGAMNLVSGLAEAYTSRVPVLALIGQPPTAHEGTGGFQDTSGLAGSIDAQRLFAEISRYCARVERPEDIAEHLDKAVAAAMRGGPAVLLLPKDIQQATVDAVAFAPQVRVPSPADLDSAIAAITGARRTGKIVIVAGDQVARNDARDQLRRLILALDAEIGVAPDAKDVYPYNDGFCGVAGTMGHAELVDAVTNSALCVLVGTRLPITARAGLDAALANTTVISIGAEQPFTSTTHTHSTDLAGDLARLADTFSLAELEAPRDDVARLTTLRVPDATGPGLRYRDAVDTIAAHLPDGTDVFADAGNTGASVVHHLRATPDSRFVVALGMGGMGYAFGAGIGSAIARDRRTFVIAGDGAFFMHGMEIHTAIEHDVPVTFVVFNNNAHAMCVTREHIFYQDRYSFNRFRPSMLGEGIAAMFPTLPAFAARSQDELATALQEIAATSGPSFIAVDCDPDEIPPFAPFLNTQPTTSPTTEEKS
ncbi:thiamine pyrophosphate-binding protein [Antrihabitans cavernicola]|uniref:acetolactate synthase n=1 Tax=Antrihabitans cavernicola TaxID=2495913 RepID=A0A5A7SJQ7_9NOCA|nr:thiamine pyrophosphate-binding protein [Spelaeibacter cavernicola]KAA0024997.1 thiamine pyrophosphate-binding protein [Spelaeibacter cavernicola]